MNLCISITAVDQPSGSDFPGDPLIETDTLGRGAEGGKAVGFRIDAQRNLAAIRTVGRFAARRTKGEIIIYAVAEGSIDFGEAAALEGHDIAQAYKDAVMGSMAPACLLHSSAYIIIHYFSNLPHFRQCSQYRSSLL